MISVKKSHAAKRVLLLKAYQPFRDQVSSPPLGILYLTTALRKRFGDRLEIDVLDLKLDERGADWLAAQLDTLQPDIVGISALNCEAEASHQLAACVKRWRPDVPAVLGGPYAHKRAEEILGSSEFDWVFGGESDRTFPEALDRHFEGKPLGTDLPGFSYRSGPDSLHISDAQDSIKDLDALGFPAWDLVDFDAYTARPNMAGVQKGKRYASIFTSRGCPYLCTYCHDIFGKRFLWRSAEHVIEEIELLRSEYGVDEIQIVDDIFNLNKPRLRKIMGEAATRWGGNMAFTFPNGLRADIMDEGIVDALSEGGTYFISIAIETVTDRLQKLVSKNLDVERALRIVNYCDDRGILTRGFFMIGFPTETKQEIRNTLNFAFQSRLTMAFFFTVVPQPGTPLFDLAREEAPEALRLSERDEREGHGYRSDQPWYQRAYGHDLARDIRYAYGRFFLSPRRMWRIARRVPLSYMKIGIRSYGRFVLRRMPRIGGKARAGAAETA